MRELSTAAHEGPNPGIIPLATKGRNPERPFALPVLLARLDAIRQSGPLEAAEYPAAREALFHLWQALQAPPASRAEPVEAYRRAAQRVTLADYRDLLDDLLDVLLSEHRAQKRRIEIDGASYQAGYQDAFQGLPYRATGDRYSYSSGREAARLALEVRRV